MPLMFTLVFSFMAGILVAINIYLSLTALLISITLLFLSVVTLNISMLSTRPGTECTKQNWLSFLSVLMSLFLGLYVTIFEIDKQLKSRVNQFESGVRTLAVIENFPHDTLYGQKALISNDSGFYQSYWPKGVKIRRGELWSLLCNYQPIKPVISPGAFDPARYSFINRINGNCLVKEYKKRSEVDFGLNAVRNHLYFWIYNQPLSIETKGIMLALLLGNKHGLTQDQKTLLQESHTSHLLVVSGLHLSLVFMIFFFFSGFLGRFISIWLHIPASHFQWLAGILSIVTYAALCGFPVPTQRAMIMFLVPFGFYINKQIITTDQVFWTAMLAVLLFDPLAIMSFSFWLSFVAVGILLLAISNGRAIVKSQFAAGALRWIMPQVAITVALTPFLWLMGLASNPASFLVNLVAIPLVSFLLIPLLILMLLIGQVSPDFLTPMGRLFEWLSHILSDIQQWGQTYQGTFIPKFSGILLFALFSLFFILPRGLPGKWTIQLFLLFSFVWQLIAPTGIKEGLNIYLLDVGQGQSAIVQQGAYFMMIDSGPGLPEAGAFRRVVLPFLDAKLDRELSAVIYSHNDSDHVSGYLNAPHEINSPLWLFGEPDVKNSAACRRHQSIAVGDMNIKILAPFSGTDFSGNRSSCVIQITSRHGCILLPGDIDKLIEYAIMANSANRSDHCDVLVASHHGSSSSTSQDWLEFFTPKIFLVSAGKMNRFGHPGTDIINKVRKMDIPWLSTQSEGSVWIQLIEGELNIRNLNRNRFYWEFVLQ